MFSNIERINKYLLPLFSFLLIAPIYLYKLGQIPYGIFCDEAKIAYEAYLLIHQNVSDFINPLFYHHFDYVFGTLPIYATVPFIELFGLNDFSTRLASVFFAILSLILIYSILGLLGSRFRLLAVLLFALTPIFFHVSRTNFGHLPSLFFVLLGYYLYLSCKIKKSYMIAVLSGLSFGFAAYGAAGWVVGVLLFLFVIIITELVENRLNWNQYIQVPIVLSIVAIVYIPIVYFTITDPGYTQRLADKNEGNAPFASVEKIQTMIGNYPKYYSYPFLFTTATIDLGEKISRHSIRGNGIFLQVSALFLLLAFIAFLANKGKERIKFLPFILLFLLYPFSDLLTTKNGSPPYSFSIFTTIYFLPFLSAYGLDFLMKVLSRHHVVKNVTLLLIIVLIAIQSGTFLENYSKYPLYSSDYWGWQYGPKEIVQVFLNEKSNYDELYMTKLFNRAGSLLAFYDPSKECQNCFIGGVSNYDPEKNQLFAFRVGQMRSIINENPDLVFRTIHTVFLPNGQAEYYIGYFIRK